MGARGHEIDLRAIGVCPGWLTRQPAVQECVQASVALKHGELRTYFPGEEAAVLDGALVCEQAFNLYEMHRMKQAAEGRR